MGAITNIGRGIGARGANGGGTRGANGATSCCCWMAGCRRNDLKRKDDILTAL